MSDRSLLLFADSDGGRLQDLDRYLTAPFPGADLDVFGDGSSSEGSGSWSVGFMWPSY
jgi:hypothetical protein